MRIVFSPQARAVLKRIRSRISDLQDGPHLGRPGRVPGTRELVIPGIPYLIPYQVSGGELQILRVYHGSRQWPERFE